MPAAARSSIPSSVPIVAAVSVLEIRTEEIFLQTMTFCPTGFNARQANTISVAPLDTYYDNDNAVLSWTANVDHTDSLVR